MLPFLRHCQATKLTDASRRVRQSEFKKKVHSVLQLCQAQDKNPHSLTVDDVTRILEDSIVNQGDIIDNFRFCQVYLS